MYERNIDVGKLIDHIVWLVYCGTATEILSCVLVVTIIYGGIVYIVKRSKCNRLRKRWNIFCGVAMIIYVFLLLYITLGKRERLQGNEFCLIPFYSYYEYMHGKVEKLRESMMNILLFYPLGLIASALSDKKRILFFGVFLSIAIEVNQYIFHLGYAEVDDVIHNSLGMIIGVLVVSMIKKCVDVDSQQC